MRKRICICVMSLILGVSGVVSSGNFFEVMAEDSTIQDNNLKVDDDNTTCDSNSGSDEVKPLHVKSIISKKKNSITVQLGFRCPKVKKYYVYLSKNKDFSSGDFVTIKNKTVTKTGLESGKKYYVKVVAIALSDNSEHELKLKRVKVK